MPDESQSRQDEDERKTTVFISSPSDAQAERDLVTGSGGVIDRLNGKPEIKPLYRFEHLAYEHGVPPEGGKVLQDVVDTYLGKAGEADVYILILSQRFGTPLLDMDGVPRVDRDVEPPRPYLSGTEYEFLHAYRENQRQHSARPVILLYRGIKPNTADTDLEQLQRVKDFFKRIEGPKAEFKGFIRDYHTPEQFADFLFDDLMRIFGRKRSDVENVPDITDFVGREREIATLTEWIDGRECRVVEMVAGGGAGKSALAARVRDLLKNNFQYVFWRTLENAPPLVNVAPRESVLEECLRFLSNHLIERLPATVDERIELLLTYLRQHRCLLVLDNFETIMQRGEQSDRFEDGYEAYGTLIERVARSDHQSCLLMTTRRQPRVMTQLEARTARVRSLALKGLSVGARRNEPLDLLRTRLDHQAGSTLDSAAGSSYWDQLTTLAAQWRREDSTFPGLERRWAEISDFYGGNPLELRLVAGRLRTELQRGSQGDFSLLRQPEQQGLPEVDDLLTEQIDPLPESERALLYWLAIRREGVTSEELDAALVTPVRSGETAAALRRLLDRSLAEGIGGNRYTLQPVILEFMTRRLVEQVCVELDTQRPGLFSSHALMTAQQTREYVRETQRRLILGKVLGHLLRGSNPAALEARLKALLADLRQTQVGRPSYAAGNILNLLLTMKRDLTGYDLSDLCVWEAYLQGAQLHSVDFSRTNLEKSVFTEPFGTILSVAYNPDGVTLAAGTGNGDIREWDAETAKPGGIWQDHTAEVWTLAYSHDGKLLASGSEDRTVKVRDVATRQIVAALDHIHPIRSVAFSPDDLLLATGGEGKSPVQDADDNTIRLYRRTRGEALDRDRWELACTLRGHANWIRSVAFSPDGRLLASGGEDGHVYVWEVTDPATAHLLVPLKLNPEADHPDRVPSVIRSVAFSPDGMTLASASEDRLIRLWDVATLVHERPYYAELRGHAARIRAIAFSPDGRRLVSGSDDRTVRIWDVTRSEPTSQQCLKTMLGHSNWMWSVAFSPRNMTVASGSEDQTVRVWDVESGKCRYVKEGYASWIRSVAFTPDETMLGSGEDRLVRWWDVRTRHCLHVMPPEGRESDGHSSWVRTVAIHPDGRTLVSCGEDHSVKFWDTNGRHLRTLRIKGDPIRTVAISPDGSLLAAAEDKTVRLWYWPADPEHDELRYFAILGRREEDTGLGGDEGHDGPVWAMAFSPDGKLLATAGEDRSVRVWAVDAAAKDTFGTCRYVLADHRNWVRALAFQPANQAPPHGLLRLFGRRARSTPMLLASGGEDGTVQLWKIDDARRQTHRLWIRDNGKGLVRSLAFDPAGKVLAVAQERVVYLCGPRTGQDIGSLDREGARHTNWIWSVAFARSGGIFASGSADLTINLWRVPPNPRDIPGWTFEGTMKSERPYERMRISSAESVSGLSPAQIASLELIGAVAIGNEGI